VRTAAGFSGGLAGLPTALHAAANKLLHQDCPNRDEKMAALLEDLGILSVAAGGEASLPSAARAAVERTRKPRSYRDPSSSNNFFLLAPPTPTYNLFSCLAKWRLPRRKRDPPATNIPGAPGRQKSPGALPESWKKWGGCWGWLSARVILLDPLSPHGETGTKLGAGEGGNRPSRGTRPSPCRISFSKDVYLAACRHSKRG